MEVTHAACVSRPLSFADALRRRTSKVAVRAEMSGQCRLRVGLTGGGDSVVVQREVSLPVRAVTWADGGGEIPRNETAVLLRGDEPSCETSE